MTTARVRSVDQLPAASQLDGTEIIPAIQQGVAVRVTTAAVARFGGGTGGGGTGPANTDALPEGTTNVYFTTARARAAISVSGSLAYNPTTGVISYTAPPPYALPAATAGALGGVKANAGTAGQFVAGVASDGSLIYATPAGGGSGGGPASTDQLQEGATNLYFTQARARAAISVSGSLAYNSSTGVISYTAPTLAAVATSGSAADLTAGTLPVARLPAHTGDVTSSAGSAALTLATVNSNVGTFNSLTVNGKGLVTAATSVAYLTANQTITLSGDVTGSGSTAITATLANTAVTAGTYTNATLTVDAKGRLTAASSGSAGGTGTVTSSGSPTSGQLALFTTATNIQGVTTLPAANYPALTGDVTNTAGSLATTIAAGAVTYAKLATAAVATAASDVWANVANKVLTAAAMWLAHAPVAWTYAATYTPDMSTFLTATMTLTGNLTLANPTNAKPGQAGEIVLTQDGTGSRVVSYGSAWKFAGGTPTASTAAGSVDVISYRVVTSSLIVCSFGKGVA